MKTDFALSCLAFLLLEVPAEENRIFRSKSQEVIGDKSNQKFNNLCSLPNTFNFIKLNVQV
jgi:hypothetical protein